MATYYAFHGIEKTKAFFREQFNTIINLFSLDFYEMHKGIMRRNSTYRVLSDFYTLVRSATSSKNLAIEDPKKIEKFLSPNYDFLKGTTLPIPCYTSLYKLETAEEKVLPVTHTRELMGSLALVPFLGPVKIDKELFISNQNIQGTATPVKDRKSEFDILLDTLSEKGRPPFMSSMYVLIAADYMGTVELKRKAEDDFTPDVNLWANPEHKEDAEFEKLYREGYKSTERKMRKLLRSHTVSN